MNKDFHYYATYYAARLAGFEDEHAKKIAWAAEMVDELYWRVAWENKDLLGDDYIVTVQNSLGEMANNLEYSNDFNTPLAQGIRGIWVPFHFLPGHFDGGYHEVLAKNLQPYDTQNINDYVNDEKVVKYMDECLKLRCAPNSETVYELLKYVKGVYSKQGLTDAGLYAIGVGMHVLADTWAHDDFCGAPCYITNKVCFVEAPKQAAPDKDTEELWKEPINDDADWKSRGVRFITDQVNSPIYTGHGQAGHLPDFDFLSYNYYPRYKCPPMNMFDMIKGRENVTRIVNSDRFWDAFQGMCNAMYYIRDDANEYIPKAIDVFGDASRADQIKSELMRNIFTAYPRYTKLEAEKLHETLVYLKAFTWRSFLQLRGYPDIVFDIKNGDLKEFAKQAKAYRNHILGFIDNKLLYIYGGPPIFDFWVPTIDSWIKTLDFRAGDLSLEFLAGVLNSWNELKDAYQEIVYLLK